MLARKLLLTVSVISLLLPQVPAQAEPATPAASERPSETLTLTAPSTEATATCLPVTAETTTTDNIPLERTFLDDFDGDSLALNKWQTHFPWDGSKLGQRTLPANKEKEIYMDPQFAGDGFTPFAIDPFHVSHGVLSITATRTPTALLGKLYNMPYTSGLITTSASFRQAYGYFEMRAKLGHGKALWPAFWLLKPKGEWPPELDVMESFDGLHPDNITMTTHWKENGVGAHKMSFCRTSAPNSDTQFHSYGVLWTKDRIVYYLDRKPIGQLATPDGLDRPMYMLANLAINGSADDSTPNDGHMDIDWIAAYQLQ